MNKNTEVLKISNYDKFRCTADKCRLTCCEGWDISIDNDTHNKWKNKGKDFNYILDNVKIKRGRRETGYYIKKRTANACPLLDEKGLCKIVKNHGEEYLSLTCHKFPRIENSFGDRMELSLSCACPEVVELISSLDGKIELVSENIICSLNGASLKYDAFEVKLREALIDICQKENLLLEHRLIAGFEMLLNILSLEEDAENKKLIELKKYRETDYIKGLILKQKNMDFNSEESIEELNNLFLDIVMNYKRITGLEIILKEISDFAENININDLSVQWSTYKNLINQYSILIENCLVSKVYGSCIGSTEDMAISFQLIILEFLLIRYAAFLKYCMNKKIDIEDIKNYITVFSRIIGNNSAAVLEYFSEESGEDIWGIDYLRFMMSIFQAYT